MAISPAPTKICGPDGGCDGGGDVGEGPGVGPVGDWLPQYPQATQTRTIRTRRIWAGRTKYRAPDGDLLGGLLRQIKQRRA
jgi:hypothetical protein